VSEAPVRLSLCAFTFYAMKMCGLVDVYLHAFRFSVTRGGEIFNHLPNGGGPG